MSQRPVGATRFAPPAIALSAGLLTAFSLPPWGLWPLAFVGVAIFAAVVDGTPRARAATGFAFGAGWMYVGMGWMWFLTVPGYLIAGALFAGLHGVAALVPGGRWSSISRPAAHTLVEALRFAFPFGGVPVASLAISQASGPLLVVVRVGGSVLLTWVVLQTGFALAAAVGWFRHRAATPPTSVDAGVWAPVVAVVAVVALAVVSPAGHETGREALTIAAVQGGGEQGTSALDVPSDRVTEAHLAATASIEPSPELDLVVWPENSIDVDDRPFEESWEFQAVVEQAARLGVPFSVGVTEDSEFSSHPTDDSFVNAQVVVTPSGEAISRYEKVRVVPFGEYVPFRGVLERLGAPLDQIPSDATRGRDPARNVLPDGTELGVMISWEVFFGDRGRDAAGDDAVILLNPTNGASYTGTILQTQQVASSRLRAAETGRWVVQVSPTGFSAFVSPDGGVYDRTEVSERSVIVRDVPQRSGTTWYRTLGDWPWVTAAGIALVVAVAADRRARRQADAARVTDATADLMSPSCLTPPT